MTITHENVSENTRSGFDTFWYHKHVSEVNILFYEIQNNESHLDRIVVLHPGAHVALHVEAAVLWILVSYLW